MSSRPESTPLHKGWTHYGPAAGLPELRQTIADYVSRTRNVPVSSEEVVVVPGGKPIIFFTILALIDAGDEVIYPNPGFPIYESMIKYSLGKAIPIPLREERDFSVDVKELASLITDRTKLIILNSPHNPTGGVLTKKDISRNRRGHRRPQHPRSVGRNLQPPHLSTAITSPS